MSEVQFEGVSSPTSYDRDVIEWNSFKQIEKSASNSQAALFDDGCDMYGVLCF